MRRSVVGLSLALAACAPSRAELFDPVRTAVRERTGIEPTWRAGATVDKRVAELLAAPLTADSAARVALLNSAALQGAYEELAIAGARYATASAPANPEVEAALRFPLEGSDPAQLELLALEDLSSLIAMPWRSGAASAELRAARRDAVARSIELIGRTRRAVYAAAAAERRVALRRTVVEAAEASAALARALHAAGNVTELDRLREVLFEEDARLALRVAEAEAVAAREELGAILGAGGGWRLADGVLDAAAPPVDAGELEREAVAANLEIAATAERLAAAGDHVAVARLESFLPHLGAGVSADRDHDGWAVGPALSLSLPLFDWGTGRREAAWAEVRRLQQHAVAAEVEVRAAARATRERLLAAEETVRGIRERLLPLREQLIDETLKQHNAMNLGAFELLLVKREQIAIEERYIDALRDAWNARTAAWELRAGARPREEH